MKAPKTKLPKPPKTLRPKKLFRWLCYSRRLELAVHVLSTEQLSNLNHHLRRVGATTGIPALIHGLVLHTAAERLMTGTNAKDP